MKQVWLKNLAVVLVALTINLSLAGTSMATSGASFSISGLGTYTLEPTLFTVESKGVPREICAMRYAGKTLISAPWVFKVNPHLPSTSSFEQSVRVEYCDGSHDLKALDTAFPWTLSENIIFLNTLLDSKKVNVTLSSSANEVGYVSISNSKGKILLSSEIAPQDSSTFSFRASSTPLAAKYVVSVTGQNSGMKSRIPVHVANKWTALKGASTFEKCSAVVWSYNHSGAPKSVSEKAVRADITEAFSRLRPHVGLRFKEAKLGQFGASESFITFDWEYSYSPTAAGAGGSYFDGRRTVGYVHINPENWWPSDDKHGGFDSKNGVNGRGWLFVHEIMHSLGLGHTVQSDQIMAPWIGQAKLGSGDIGGLQFLYDPKSCRS